MNKLKLFGVATIIIALGGLAYQNGLFAPKLDLDKIYAACTRRPFVGNCTGSNCVSSESAKRAIEVWKTAITRAHGITREYFDEHFELINVGNREVDYPEGRLEITTIDYDYKISWIKFRNFTVVSYWLDREDAFERAVKEESEGTYLWRFNLQEPQVLSKSRMEREVAKKYRLMGIKYDFCDINFTDSSRGTSLVLPGNFGCDWAELNLMTGRRSVYKSSCLIE